MGIKNNNKIKSDLWWTFWKAETVIEFEKLIRDTAWLYIILGFILLIVGYFVDTWMIIDGVVALVIGVWLKKSPNRIGGFICGLYGISALGTTTSNWLGITEGGTNIFLAMALFWASVGACYATFKI